MLVSWILWAAPRWVWVEAEALPCHLWSAYMPGTSHIWSHSILPTALHSCGVGSILSTLQMTKLRLRELYWATCSKSASKHLTPSHSTGHSSSLLLRFHQDDLLMHTKALLMLWPPCPRVYWNHMGEGSPTSSRTLEAMFQLRSDGGLVINVGGQGCGTQEGLKASEGIRFQVSVYSPVQDAGKSDKTGEAARE